jgi:hypothetical protein
MPVRVRPSRRLWHALAAALVLVGASTSWTPAAAAGPKVWRVGSFNGIGGQFATIQDAVNHANAGDWILVGPGDYHESGIDAGVLIKTPHLHLRGMDRNNVVVDGTRSGAPACSANVADQVPGRNGIEVYKANGVYIENLTVCNFVTDAAGEEGNQIWWNGGDGSGQLGMNGYWGNYLTATSTYANGFGYPAGNYGIFSSNATNGSFNYSYASNMADSAFYIGACQQLCNATMNHDRGQYSSLCLSSTNAGGYVLIENTECDQNKTGLVSNSQNNDDWPPPQIGLCPSGQTGATGTASCTVWEHNYIHDNNNPNVPGNGTSGLAGSGPVGTGLILAGSTYVTLYANDVENNGAWGELIADLPDQEAAPDRFGSQCAGGIWVPAVQLCYFQAYGNVSLDNQFRSNGFFGNPSNGDVGLATIVHDPGNCFSGDSDPGGLTTDPGGIEHSANYQPVNAMCTQANGGDMAVLGAEALCATQLLAPCPTLNTLCLYAPSLPCIPAPSQPLNYPRPTQLEISMPPRQESMANPCSGVPSNPWCPS